MSGGKDAPSRYSAVAILLHWLIAAAIVFLVPLGIYMHELPREEAALKFELYQLHKSVGVTVLVLSALRLIWRLLHPAPALPAKMKRWEVALAKLTHLAFYALMLGIPFLGWIMVSTDDFNVPTVLYGVIYWPHLPGLRDLAAADSINWVAVEAHKLLAFFTVFLLLLHIAAALKHHFLDRDDVLTRMLPFLKVRGG